MSTSLCVLRIEVDEELPEMEENISEAEMAKEQNKKDRGSRESKMITVETYASVLMGPNAEGGTLPKSSRRTPPKGSSVSENDDVIAFFCGNPLVEVTKGLLHIYKENELKEPDEAKMLCLLYVPGAFGARDLLAFVAACQQDIAYVRVLRDGSPDHYMALITFRTSQSAQDFHAAFDGVPYSSLEPNALCHMAWISRIEWARDGTPPANHTELPTCPVCLERMDESVAGVLSVQCAHAFHADCLLGWGDASCPVCRCAQTPEPRDHAQCAECARTTRDQHDSDESENADDTKENISGIAEGLLDGVDSGALWICLICGHVGCGRYEGGHAAKHFLQSNHTYALQLGSNRVWDYAGDNFVHRLVQNKSDGKLVAAGGTGAGGGACGGPTCLCTHDKLDAAQLEFTYLLTQQLDRQRQFYDDKIDRLEIENAAKCEKLNARATEAETEAAKLKERVSNLTKENKQLEKKLNNVTHKLSTLQSELNEERSIAAALAKNQAEWQTQAKLREDKYDKEVKDLKEQLRDVMFFIEARGKLETSESASRDELADASVTVGPRPTNSRTRKKRR